MSPPQMREAAPRRGPLPALSDIIDETQTSGPVGHPALDVPEPPPDYLDEAPPPIDPTERERFEAELDRLAPEANGFRVVGAFRFATEAEDGADPLLGDVDDALIPEGGEVLVYGDGGAGKTTLTVDGVCHWCAGDDWLGITVKRPLTILLIEDEGPRPLFRRKLARKLEAWRGSSIGHRLHVLEDPWAEFTFAAEEHRHQLADIIRDRGLDVVVVGPITVAGMDEAGTIQETRAFQTLLAEVRQMSGRRVTFILIHHENKGGKVSGAWEGTGDTLLHVTNKGAGRTRLHIQKARWAPTWHARTLELAWAEGDSFEVIDKPEMDDDAIAEKILAFVATHPGTGWGKVEEAVPGIKAARRRAVRDDLLQAGSLVNIGREGGVDVWLDQVPERKAARLHSPDDPTIRHLRPERDAAGTQAASADEWGGVGCLCVLRPVP